MTGYRRLSLEQTSEVQKRKTVHYPRFYELNSTLNCLRQVHLAENLCCHDFTTAKKRFVPVSVTTANRIDGRQEPKQLRRGTGLAAKSLGAGTEGGPKGNCKLPTACKIKVRWGERLDKTWAQAWHHEKKGNRVGWGYVPKGHVQRESSVDLPNVQHYRERCSSGLYTFERCTALGVVRSPSTRMTHEVWRGPLYPVHIHPTVRNHHIGQGMRVCTSRYLPHCSCIGAWQQQSTPSPSLLYRMCRDRGRGGSGADGRPCDASA